MAPTETVTGTWPPAVHDDADVLVLDDQGRYIICRVCEESFTSDDGETPKPVPMHVCFDVHAWETHKRCTQVHWRPQSANTESSQPREAQLLASQPTIPPAQSTDCSATPVVTDAGDIETLEPSVRTVPADQQQRPSCDGLDAVQSLPAYEAASGHNFLGGFLITLATEASRDCGPIRTPTSTGKRQRVSSSPRANGRSISAERRATHALYWKTMRELFSTTKQRNSSDNGDTDDSGSHH